MDNARLAMILSLYTVQERQDVMVFGTSSCFERLGRVPVLESVLGVNSSGVCESFCSEKWACTPGTRLTVGVSHVYSWRASDATFIR